MTDDTTNELSESARAVLKALLRSDKKLSSEILDGMPKLKLLDGKNDAAKNAANGGKFDLGDVMLTPRAMLELPSPGYAARLLALHHRGIWGVVCDDDQEANNEALQLGNSILSAYPIDPDKECLGHGDNTVWIITEADRSCTTIMLPEEY